MINKMEKLMERIVIDPKVRHGKPVIMGTRVPVEVVLGSLAGGMRIGDICKEYGIKRGDLIILQLLLPFERSGHHVSGRKVWY